MLTVLNKNIYITIIILIVLLAGCRDNGEVKRTQLLMGTMVEISVADSNLSEASKIEAIEKAFRRIKDIEDQMSVYKQTSEVSKVNNFADIRPVSVSEDIIKVLKRSDEINKITSGAFDITVAPLVDLWGFGPKTSILRIPQDKEIKDVLRLVGMNKLKVDYARKTVNFTIPGMKIDLGGIAVGYAVDCAAEVLRDNGINNAMVNGGGEVLCMGKSSWGRPWRVGIQHPRIKDKLLDIVSIEDRAISTSGDYEKIFFWEKKRISHIINPLTGMPVTDSPASVTIIAPDCMTADSLSTAIDVLGPNEGVKVLKNIKSVSGMIAVDNGKTIEVYTVNGFKSGKK